MREAAVARAGWLDKTEREGGELAALFSITTSTVTVAPTNVLAPHWRRQFPRQPFTAPNIRRIDRKGKGGGCDLERSQTYGVGGGKLWHQGGEEQSRITAW